jgi:hypothetical protein
VKRTIVAPFDLEVPEGKPMPEGSELATYLATILEPSAPEQDDPFFLSNLTVYIDTENQD